MPAAYCITLRVFLGTMRSLAINDLLNTTGLVIAEVYSEPGKSVYFTRCVYFEGVLIAKMRYLMKIGLRLWSTLRRYFKLGANNGWYILLLSCQRRQIGIYLSYTYAHKQMDKFPGALRQVFQDLDQSMEPMSNHASSPEDEWMYVIGRAQGSWTC